MPSFVLDGRPQKMGALHQSDETGFLGYRLHLSHRLPAFPLYLLDEFHVAT